MTFQGFPDAALDFYDDLELDNSREFWQAHQTTYIEAVAGPMKALCAQLEPEFGPIKIFRPYRDVRFAKDKTPYKTHQGAFAATGPATGYYLELSARGVRVGGGFYEASTPRLTALRQAIVDDRSGPALVRLLQHLQDDGWSVSGDQLKTAPRGFDKTHPRIEFLRHKQLFVERSYGFEADAIGPGLPDRVRADWRALTTLLDWLHDHGSPGTGEGDD